MTSQDDKIIQLRTLLTDIAQTYGLAGPAEAAVAFVVRHPARGIPITGSENRDRISGAIQAINTAMDRQDWYAIVAATNPSLFI